MLSALRWRAPKKLAFCLPVFETPSHGRLLSIRKIHGMNTSPATMERTYENALKIIESRQRRARPSATVASSPVSATSSSIATPGLRGTPSIEGMAEWLQMLGHSQKDLSALNIIHVAGTKGKGSTCAFIESLLRAHGRQAGYPRKTGLYTSPHLIRPEERVRLNSQPLSPEFFAKYFFEVYDRLPQLAAPYEPSNPIVVERGPRYLQLYALLAFHTFLREGVDVAIVETHNGGEFDATNVIQHPVVTAITTLGMDHIDMLGPTIENIAWHKAGIFKAGAVALTCEQEDGLEGVLEMRAGEKGFKLAVVGEDARLPKGLAQLKPAVQRTNASLAIAACEAWLRRKSTSPSEAALTPQDIHKGISSWSWPGRFQTLTVGKHTYFLDAAHNTLSIKLAAQWFAESSHDLSSSATKVLMFTHINELRDAEALLRTLATALRDAGVQIEEVVFTTYHATREAAERADGEVGVPGSWHKVWRDVFPKSQVYERLSIDAAVEHARTLARGEAHLLVTGSQHLVGPVLQILESDQTS